jgi:hypothetical protein
MKAMIRHYTGLGAVELFRILEAHAADLEAIMRSVKGFFSYTLVRNDDGGFAITLCQDNDGIEESAQKAREWITENAMMTGAFAPEVTVGNVVLYVK